MISSSANHGVVVCRVPQRYWIDLHTNTALLQGRCMMIIAKKNSGPSSSLVSLPNAKESQKLYSLYSSPPSPLSHHFVHNMSAPTTPAFLSAMSSMTSAAPHSTLATIKTEPEVDDIRKRDLKERLSGQARRSSNKKTFWMRPSYLLVISACVIMLGYAATTQDMVLDKGRMYVCQYHSLRPVFTHCTYRIVYTMITSTLIFSVFQFKDDSYV
jgi:hypothetical protein